MGSPKCYDTLHTPYSTVHVLTLLGSLHSAQETFPYTRGTGTADAVVVDGYVQLGFALKRGVVDEETGDEVPLLVRAKVCSLKLLRLFVVGEALGSSDEVSCLSVSVCLSVCLSVMLGSAVFQIVTE